MSAMNRLKPCQDVLFNINDCLPQTTVNLTLVPGIAYSLHNLPADKTQEIPFLNFRC